MHTKAIKGELQNSIGKRHKCIGKPGAFFLFTSDGCQICISLLHRSTDRNLKPCSSMSHYFTKRIESLRKKSRDLLANVKENSWKVESKLKLLHLQNLSSRENLNKQYQIAERNSEFWRLRNDSSGVGGALCPEYFRSSPKNKSLSAPDMTSIGRILIKSSKTHPKLIPVRKPVKECYCYPEARRMQCRSNRTKYKPSPQCNYCRNHFDIVTEGAQEEELPISKSHAVCTDHDEPEVPEMRNKIENSANKVSTSDEKDGAQTPLSTETLRKVQKITYSPRSQFLRNVQSKISSLHNSFRSASEPVSVLALKRHTSNMSQDDNMTQSPKGINCKESIRTDVEEPETEHAKSVSRRAVKKDVAVNHSSTYVNKDMQIPSEKSLKTKSLMRRTVMSKKPEQQFQKMQVKSSPRNRIVRLIQNDRNSACCVHAKCRGHDDQDGKYENCKEYCKHMNWSLKRSNFNYGSDNDYENNDDLKDVRDLQKFREQNYFDTHGSSHTLLSSGSSRSSGSLRQYQLNDRLFPEHVRNIHRDDLVVSIPPCATKQRKRVHYFPRYIVRQEKNSCDKNYKKRRCQSCPLTGHAIDLGILKVSHPPNSLALKYQKGVP